MHVLHVCSIYEPSRAAGIAAVVSAAAVVSTVADACPIA